jgi:hypothetical protein
MAFLWIDAFFSTKGLEKDSIFSTFVSTFSQCVD